MAKQTDKTAEAQQKQAEAKRDEVSADVQASARTLADKMNQEWKDRPSAKAFVVSSVGYESLILLGGDESAAIAGFVRCHGIEGQGKKCVAVPEE